MGPPNSSSPAPAPPADPAAAPGEQPHRFAARLPAGGPAQAQRQRGGGGGAAGPARGAAPGASPAAAGHAAPQAVPPQGADGHHSGAPGAGGWVGGKPGASAPTTRAVCGVLPAGHGCEPAMASALLMCGRAHAALRLLRRACKWWPPTSRCSSCWPSPLWTWHLTGTSCGRSSWWCPCYSPAQVRGGAGRRGGGARAKALLPPERLRGLSASCQAPPCLGRLAVKLALVRGCPAFVSAGCPRTLDPAPLCCSATNPAWALPAAPSPAPACRRRHLQGPAAPGRHRTGRRPGRCLPVPGLSRERPVLRELGAQVCHHDGRAGAAGWPDGGGEREVPKVQL